MVRQQRAAAQRLGVGSGNPREHRGSRGSRRRSRESLPLWTRDPVPLTAPRHVQDAFQWDVLRNRGAGLESKINSKGNNRMFRRAIIKTALLLSAHTASAQTFTTPNPMLQRIWDEGVNNSQVQKYAQALLDSVGPRLTGSPGHQAGNDWLVAVYKSLGISARQEQYGTWKGWRRGITHVDLLTPRVRSLEGMMLAWSPGTRGGQPVQGAAVVLPQVENRQEFQRWLQTVRGKFVLVSYPHTTCRPATSWNAGALPDVARRAIVEDSTGALRWQERMDTSRTGIAGQRALHAAIEQAGALALISSNWSNGWGVEKIFN